VMIEQQTDNIVIERLSGTQQRCSAGVQQVVFEPAAVRAG
jgi:hypothetical protein